MVFTTLTIVNLNLFFVKGRSDIVLQIDILKKLIGFAVFILFLAGCVGFYIYMSKAMGRPTIIDEFNEMANPTDTPTPTPGPNYRITPEDIEDDLDDFIESGGSFR